MDSPHSMALRADAFTMSFTMWRHTFTDSSLFTSHRTWIHRLFTSRSVFDVAHVYGHKVESLVGKWMATRLCERVSRSTGHGVEGGGNGGVEEGGEGNEGKESKESKEGGREGKRSSSSSGSSRGSGSSGSGSGSGSGGRVQAAARMIRRGANGRPPCRADITLVGKGGHPYPRSKRLARLEPEELNKDLCESLERLQTTYLDVFLLHRDDPSLFPDIGRVVETMDAFVKDGRVLRWGTSNWTLSRTSLSVAASVCVSV